MLHYCPLACISDGVKTRLGTVRTPYEHFYAWRRVNDGDAVSTLPFAETETMIKGVYSHERFLEIFRDYIYFQDSIYDSDEVEIVCRYPQFFAARLLKQSIVNSVVTRSGKGGTYFGATGCGKTYTMAFLARQLALRCTDIPEIGSPTIILIVDRDELQKQGSKLFTKSKEFLNLGEVSVVKNRTQLRQELGARQSGGFYICTIQKFCDREDDKIGLINDRQNIICFSDEAHRTQLEHSKKIQFSKDADENMKAMVSKPYAKVLKEAFPHATFVGFTGTPIAQKDRSTREVFGDYIDVYDMTQSVDDGATRPVFYESRVINLKLDEQTLRRIDAEYDAMAEEAEEYVIEKSKRELGRLDSIFGADATVASLCEDIVKHYEEFRQYEQTGKAMIVAYSRPIAIKIYRRILEMRPVWGDKLAVVMTSGNKDPEDWRAIIGNDSHKKELEKRFKDNDSSLKIVIVVDMWLTGFDVPSLSTMYVYKPMSGHNLMQAIARVNRVFGDKQGGLVVDYVGIASALKTAMNDYTYRDRKNYGDTDVAKTAYPEFQKKLDVCRDLMYGFNYGAFFGKSDLERAKAISGGVDFMQSPERMETKKLYIKEALLLRQALSLCQSLLNYEQRIEAAYFEAVRTLLTRVEGKGKISFREINGRINELLKQSIKSEGVINLFSDIKEEFSLFDPKFLEEVARMKERNFAVELLRRLIAEQVQLYQRTNTVRAEKFSEILSDAMSRYLKGMLTNEEVIEELLKIAREIVFGEKAGESLNLNSEELAFYDALTKPEAVKDFYSNDQLIAITRELTDALRRNKTIDWNMKESARAGMRRIVKRLLKKYDYPPAGQEDALNTIMEQCKKWNENN